MTTPELPPLHWVGAMQIDNASFQSLATEASVYARERILLARIAELEADVGRYQKIVGPPKKKLIKRKKKCAASSTQKTRSTTSS